MLLIPALEAALTVVFEETEMCIEFAPDARHFRDTLSKADNNKFVRDACREVTGKDMGVRIVVKDPSADSEIKVISPQNAGASSGGLFGGLFKGKMKEEDIMARFPSLMSTKEDDLWQGLHDMLCAAYDADADFTNAAPFLAKKMGAGNSERIRMQALATWGNVLNNKATPQRPMCPPRYCGSFSSSASRLELTRPILQECA